MASFNSFKASSQYWDEQRVLRDPLLQGLTRYLSYKEYKAGVGD